MGAPQTHLATPCSRLGNPSPLRPRTLWSPTTATSVEIMGRRIGANFRRAWRALLPCSSMCPIGSCCDMGLYECEGRHCSHLTHHNRCTHYSRMGEPQLNMRPGGRFRRHIKSVG